MWAGGYYWTGGKIMAKKLCGSCKLYTPSEKLKFQTWQRMCQKYTGWCKHWQEERDNDEPVCEYYMTRQSNQKKVKA